MLQSKDLEVDTDEAEEILLETEWWVQPSVPLDLVLNLETRSSTDITISEEAGRRLVLLLSRG
jgi:hypothetical protein